MAAVFGIVSVVAFIWSAIRTQRVHTALIDSFPPELKDELTVKFALHSIALSPSTPLSLQADYMKSLAAGCIAMLCFSLALFSADRIEGWLAFGGFVLVAFSTIKSWRAYRVNCDRVIAHQDDGDEP